MDRQQNVIVFSAGESDRNGKVKYVQSCLEKSNICCKDWRDLFRLAHDADQIALLPSLQKKIPTFDFALILAEGVDSVEMRGTEHYTTMRDNVVFEIGMCVMALGAERVILLAEDTVRIPDDLTGIDKLGLEYIPYARQDFDRAVARLGEAIREKGESLEALAMTQLNAVIHHINTNAGVISPVFVGAAVSSAEAYFSNFIVRLLEHMDKGFRRKGHPEDTPIVPASVALEVVFPTDVTTMNGKSIRAYFQRCRLQEYLLESAGSRALFFCGSYDPASGTLTVVDVPTSVTASYSVVSAILNMESDDEYDHTAEARFVTKEMDIYKYTLEMLFKPPTARKRLGWIKDPEKQEEIIRALQNVTLRHDDLAPEQGEDA